MLGSTRRPVGSDTKALTVTPASRIEASSCRKSLSLVVQNSTWVKPSPAAARMRSPMARPPSAKSHSTQGDRTQLSGRVPYGSFRVGQDALHQAVGTLIHSCVGRRSLAESEVVRKQGSQLQLRKQLHHDLLAAMRVPERPQIWAY